MKVIEDLAQEKRAGVPHFVTGQHRAWKDDEDALLRFVNVMGWAVLVLLSKTSTGWQPMAQAHYTATGVGRSWTPAEDFELSAAMLEALENAEALEEAGDV